ncbi:MAG TPA: YciI family protein [Gemmatimonadales bacterium]|nr:YciI family protein [Gemmatimonadales bacterium]
MRFITIVKSRETKNPPPPELFAAIDRLGQEAAKAGVMVGVAGFLPTELGARVQLKNGKVTVTDGPFPESKDTLGGYSIYNLPSKEKAIEWSKRFLQLHIDHWKGWEGEVEVRQMFDAPGEAR